MGMKDNLTAEVKATFAMQWSIQTATSVPKPEDLRLNANHAKDVEAATVLYADLAACRTLESSATN